ncbi:MAG: DUF4253 domain-containing protein [Myxococcota bacterium]
MRVAGALPPRQGFPVEVTHPKFGRGRVIRPSFRGQDPKLEVDFADHGTKTLLARFCRQSDGFPIVPTSPEPLCVAGVPLPSLAPLYPGGRYGVGCSRVPSSLAGLTWRAFSERAPTTRTWPVLLMDDVLVSPDVEASPREVLAAAADLAIQDLIYEDGDPELAEEVFDRDDPDDGVPQWFRPRDAGGSGGTTTGLALVQVDVAWKVPAYLPSPSDGPPAPARTAFLRYYSARYGPRVYRAGTSSLEVWVARRPQRWDEARDLAEEHLRFCPPLMENDDRMSLEKYTAYLLESERWFFDWSSSY